MTIFRKGLLLISLPFLLQVMFMAYLAQLRVDLQNADRAALHSKDVIATANQATAFLIEAQGASRGYIVTANPVFEEEFRTSLDQSVDLLRHLQDLVSDNPQQSQRLREGIVKAEAMSAWLREQTTAVREGQQNVAVDHVRALRGRNLLMEFRAAMTAFLSEEERLDSIRSAQAAHARMIQGWSLALAAIATACATGIAVYLFGTGITARLSVVTDNAARLAGNQPLEPPVKGRDEIAVLDSVLHQSSVRLKEAATSEEHFRKELEDRARELAQTNESLRQQTQDNEMFVYSVSHDLRSPLVNLQGFGKELIHAGDELNRLLSDARVPEDLRAKVRAVVEADVLESVNFIQSAVTRSSTIIDALLRLSRAGRVEYRWQAVDVASIVRRIISAMRSSIEQRNADVQTLDLKQISGDPTAIEQVFANLIGNAVNYLDPARPGRVEIGMINNGDADADGLRTYYVRDNGLGIPAAYIAKVFVAFQRLHGDVALGEGIGLALVRRIVERHGGRIWVESDDGRGTSFFVALPVDPPQQQQPDGTTAAV